MCTLQIFQFHRDFVLVFDLDKVMHTILFMFPFSVLEGQITVCIIMHSLQVQSRLIFS